MQNTLTEELRKTIRDVKDFPKPGIIFKDITPVLADPEISKKVSEALFNYWREKSIDALVGVESRGFIYGLQLAQQLHVPFIPVRKAGKLPYETIKHAYDLEYGSAEIEIHIDAIKKGQNVLIHDDLLATGGTAKASAELIKKIGGNIAGFSFLVELSFLRGRANLERINKEIQALVSF